MGCFLSAPFKSIENRCGDTCSRHCMCMVTVWLSLQAFEQSHIRCPFLLLLCSRHCSATRPSHGVHGKPSNPPDADYPAPVCSSADSGPIARIPFPAGSQQGLGDCPQPSCGKLLPTASTKSFHLSSTASSGCSRPSSTSAGVTHPFQDRVVSGSIVSSSQLVSQGAYRSIDTITAATSFTANSSPEEPPCRLKQRQQQLPSVPYSRVAPPAVLPQLLDNARPPPLPPAPPRVQTAQLPHTQQPHCTKCSSCGGFARCSVALLSESGSSSNSGQIDCASASRILSAGIGGKGSSAHSRHSNATVLRQLPEARASTDSLSAVQLPAAPLAMPIHADTGNTGSRATPATATLAAVPPKTCLGCRFSLAHVRLPSLQGHCCQHRRFSSLRCRQGSSRGWLEGSVVPGRHRVLRTVGTLYPTS